MTAWSPRVDPESNMPFMFKEPIDIMKEGSYTHVPWIVGNQNDTNFRRKREMNEA